MNKRHAVCLVVDGLRASALGAYGNTSYPTPYLDTLASRSVVVDWFWSDGIELTSFYRGVWQELHALRASADSPEVPQLLERAGARQWLVTDDPWLTGRTSELPLDKTLLIETSADQPAATIEETQLAQLFSETVLQLDDWRSCADQDDDPSLLWLHTRGLMGPWDAPIAHRVALLEEGDPPPLDIVQAPGVLRDVEDPDEILAYRVAYAAQMAILDTCVGAFYNALEACFAESEMLLMLVGSGGFALGEHGAIGSGASELLSEKLHVPWLIHLCGNRRPCQRHAALSQPADVGATLLDWFGLRCPTPADGLSLLPALRGQKCTGRQMAVTRGDRGERAIRTPAWLLRRASADACGSVPAKLYAKPDDRWEFNDVASRCPEVVESLDSELARFESCASSGDPLPTAPGDLDLC